MLILNRKELSNEKKYYHYFINFCITTFSLLDAYNDKFNNG